MWDRILEKSVKNGVWTVSCEVQVFEKVFRVNMVSELVLEVKESNFSCETQSLRKVSKIVSELVLETKSFFMRDTVLEKNAKKWC